MIVCPVCEHSQAQGAECEVCGKRLLHGAAGRPSVAPVEGLEPTHHAAVEPGVERVEGLEPTHHAAAAPGAQERAPDLEPTAAAPVDVAAAPVPDLEPTAAEPPDDPRTAVPAFVTCRYCRTPALPGERVCARCGMRLPSFEPARRGGVPAARICSCGTPVPGARCPACGARNA